MNVSTILIASSSTANSLDLDRAKRIILTANELGIKFICFDHSLITNYLASIKAEFAVCKLRAKTFNKRNFETVEDAITSAIYQADDIIYVGEGKPVNLVQSLKGQKLSY